MTHFHFGLLVLVLVLTGASRVHADADVPSSPDQSSRITSDKLGADEWGIEVRCVRPTSTDLAASARGTLRTTSRDKQGNFYVSGTLQLSMQIPGDSQTERTATVAVTGIMNKVSAETVVHAAKNAPDFETIWIESVDDDSSMLIATDPRDPTGPVQPSMNCGKSVMRRPVIADLVVLADPTRVLTALQQTPAQILVQNIGTIPFPAGPIRVKVGDAEDGYLHRLDNVNGSEDPLPVDAVGAIQADFLSDRTERCRIIEVDLDLDESAQHAPSDAWTPFHNDSLQVDTPCLTWTMPIDETSLGGPVGSPLIRGVTIKQIVSSEVIARESDHQPCSHCHYPGSQAVHYHPDAGDIWPEQRLSGDDTVRDATWRQSDGWAQRFIDQSGGPGQTTKPEYLKAVFRRWLQDGAH